MIITRLQLTNFGCHRDLKLDLTKKKVAIVGDHASGKSTVLDAITYLFTSRCRGLDDGGRGVLAHLLTKDVDGPLSVSANVVIKDTTYQVTRTFVSGSTGFAVKAFGQGGKDWSGGTEDQETAWFSLLGVSREAVLAMLDAETFLRREHADAKGLLLDFLNASITVPETGEIITLQDCDHRYTEAFERRKVVNRDLKRTSAPQKPDKEVGDIEAVKATLAALEAVRDAQVKRQGELEGLGAAAQAQRDELAGKLEAAKASVPALPEGYADWDAYLAEAQTAVKTARQALDANDARVTGSDDPALAGQLTRIKAHEPSKGCVLDASIECKTSLTQFVTFVKKHTPTGEKAKPSDTAKLLKALDAAKADLKVRTDTWELSERAQKHIVRYTDELSALDDKLNEGTVEGADVDAELKDLVAKTEETTTRLIKGREILAAKQRRQVEWETYTKQHEAYSLLVKQSDEAEAEVVQYGPKGIRVAALEAATAGWTLSVNAILEPFGYQLRLSVDPWGIIVNGTPTVRLSTSERLRLTIALQVAMAGTCGFGLTLIDSVDWLLKPYRNILMQVLTHAGLDQVIMAKAQDRDVPIAISESTQVIQL